ncbi:MAG: hypothetical protein QOE45_1521 [Frankiaceae bacterium]|jgi:D-lactate dehydrogenase (cytochrome)|nr:hypothetical protein [Frankiaceae bacterium]
MAATSILPGVQTAVEVLTARFGAQLSTSAAVLEQHGTDESWHPPVLPDVVVFAESTQDVADAVRICAAHRLPVVAFGAGTSLEGHIAALRGGLSLDLSRMNALVELNVADLDVTVQAGMTRLALNDRLKRHGLFFPVDPGADASLGGMASTRASGTNAVRYGTMRENVLSLTVVLADGRVIRTGGRARKSSAGYDLTRLFVGAEGTLGIVTEVTLRLQGLPEAVSAATCAFPSVTDAVEAVIEVIQSGTPVARAELLDETQIRACNAYSGLGLPELPHLFFEFHGTPASVQEQAEYVATIAASHGAAGFEWATAAEDRTRLWKARHDAYYAGLALRPGAKGWATDVCVPISRLAECLGQTKVDLDASPLISAVVGHVGDGNFHVLFLLDPGDLTQQEEAARLNVRMVRRALTMGGTCSGEHGIGYGKKDLLIEEHGEAIEVMRLLKTALDPDNILNPGKVVDI